MSEAQQHSNGFELDQLLKNFAEATGWQPRPLQGTPHSRTSMDPDAPALPLRKRMQLISTAPIDGMLDFEDLADVAVTSEETAWKLLEQIDHLVQRLDQAETTIEKQEAQLATALGVSIRSDESEVLASKLNESLQRAAELTGSDAAALYLLDDNTSQLKMRSCYGLDVSALAKPARELRGAMADLEALMGNAVLLENTELAEEWNCPEKYAAAMCLPIGSPTMPHGTLWLWSNHVRDFSSLDIDAAKAAGDKILADIERSVLADEVLKNRSISRDIESASLVQSSRLPSAQPLHCDYDVSGWTFQGRALGGNFHNWTVNRASQICVALGSAAVHGPSGALVATSLQTVVETCWNSKHKPAQILRKANDLLWDSQDGDWRSSLFYAQIHPDSGSAEIGLAGDIQAFVVGSRGYRMVRGVETSLAVEPDTKFYNEQLYLEAGELWVVASADVLGGAARGGFSQDALIEQVRQWQDEPVDEIVDHLARMLPMASVDDRVDFDRSLLILRRKF